MDVNNINAVVNAMINILPQIGFQSVEKTAIKATGPSVQNPGLAINVGVIGQLKGSIVILMDLNSAKMFASKMMMGMPVAALDEMAQSAIGEMSNMVCASACTNLSQLGVTGLDISPPTLIIAECGTIKVSAPALILISFVADGIPFQLGIGLN